MKELSALEIVSKIRRKEQINALVKGGFLKVKINSYVPCIAMALHGGNKVDLEFSDILKLKGSQREMVEESFSDFYINKLPIQLIVKDSKSIYDISKKRDACINNENLSKELNSFQKEKILKNYNDFYLILSELVKVLSRSEKNIFVYDIHGKKQEKLMEINTNNKKAMSRAVELIKSFEEIDEKIIKNNFDIKEEKNEFIKKLDLKYKNINYIGIYVNEIYKEKYKNDYYINFINRIRYLLIKSINEFHIEEKKEKTFIIED